MQEYFHHDKNHPRIPTRMVPVMEDNFKLRIFRLLQPDAIW